MPEWLKKIASFLYGTGVRIRNLMFDMGILHSERFDIPVICVGNITVGGTGKTPTAEMIVEAMSDRYNVALLSRGYGRRTKGFREVSLQDSYRDVGDEPLQIKMKYPNSVVVVCEDRAEGIRRIRVEHPEVNLIVMDDGFQHRRVTAMVNVVVIDATRPVEKDHLLPYGSLRDTMSSLSRANYFIVSKCTPAVSPLARSLMKKVLLKAAFQKIYFMRYAPMPVCRVFPETDGEDAYPVPASRYDEVIAMSGIGNPSVFIDDLRNRFTLVDALTFEDHHIYRIGDLRRMTEMLKAHPSACILTTEKDAVKLFNSSKIPDALKERIFYQPVKLVYIEDSDNDFLTNLYKDVRAN